MSILEKILIAIVVIGLAIGVSYGIGRRDGFNEAAKESFARVDTIFVYDTITQYKPIYTEKRIVEKVYVPTEVSDTIWKHDTLYVPMQKEQLVWQDSLSRVYASGILPQIDSVKHFIPQIIITTEQTKIVKKPCRWGLGVHVGYGIQIGKQITLDPYVGIGLSYNILSW